MVTNIFVKDNYFPSGKIFNKLFFRGVLGLQEDYTENRVPIRPLFSVVHFLLQYDVFVMTDKFVLIR